MFCEWTSCKHYFWLDGLRGTDQCGHLRQLFHNLHNLFYSLHNLNAKFSEVQVWFFARFVKPLGVTELPSWAVFVLSKRRAKIIPCNAGRKFRQLARLRGISNNYRPRGRVISKGFGFRGLWNRENVQRLRNRIPWREFAEKNLQHKKTLFMFLPWGAMNYSVNCEVIARH